MTTETKALVRAEAQPSTIDRYAYEPRDWSDAARMAEALVKSGMLPKGIGSPQAALALIVQGRELGLSVMQSLRGVHVIQGRPTMSADLMVALVLRSGLARYMTCVETSATQATWATHRHGAPAEQRLTFTLDEAKGAGLTSKDTWKQYPAAMLRARAASALARMAYPDVLFGVYLPEEMERGGHPDVVDVPTVPEQQALPPPRGPEATPIVDVDALVRRKVAATQRLDSATRILGRERAAGIAGPKPAKTTPVADLVAWMERVAADLEAEIEHDKRGSDPAHDSAGDTPWDPAPMGGGEP